MKLLFTGFLLLISLSAWALVDYSEAVAVPAGAAKPASTPKATSGAGEKYFNLSTGLERMTVPYQGRRNKVSFYSFNANFQTPYSLFLTASYWGAQTDSSALSTKKSLQAGNPQMKLGFNWLSFGSSQDLATFDILAGLMFPGPKTSEFASSRMDKMVGVELTKRFYTLALQLGYEYRFVGTVKRDSEVTAGDIQKISAALGWRVSSDIRMALETVMFNIKREANSPLVEDIKFATLAPKLSLGLTPDLDLELSALYQTRKTTLDANLMRAKLWDLKGLYGNSLFANLALAL